MEWLLHNDAFHGTGETLADLFGPRSKPLGCWQSKDTLITGNGGALPRTVKVRFLADVSDKGLLYWSDVEENTLLGLWEAVAYIYQERFETQQDINEWWHKHRAEDNTEDMPKVGDYRLFPRLARDDLTEEGLRINEELSDATTVVLDLQVRLAE